MLRNRLLTWILLINVNKEPCVTIMHKELVVYWKAVESLLNVTNDGPMIFTCERVLGLRLHFM